MKKIIIALAHSTHLDPESPRLEIELEGGSPYFSYIWIDDVCHTIYKGNRSVSIKNTKI